MFRSFRTAVFVLAAVLAAVSGWMAEISPIGIAQSSIAYMTYKKLGRALLVHGSADCASAKMPDNCVFIFFGSCHWAFSV